METFLKQLFIHHVLVGLLILLSVNAVIAGAWTAEEGKSYNRFALNSFYSDENYDDNGNKETSLNNGDFIDYNLNYYLEYGVTGRATIISSLYFKYLQKEDGFNKEEAWGMGDIDLGLKYTLWEGHGGVISTQALAKIPEAYDDEDVLSLGDGIYDFELRMLHGQSLWKFFPGYYNIEAAYRWREGSAVEQFRYLLELGSNFGEKCYGRIKLDGIKSLADDAETIDALSNPTTTAEYDLGKLDIALGYKITSRYALEVGAAPTIYGENTAAGTTYTIAFAFQL